MKKSLFVLIATSVIAFILPVVHSSYAQNTTTGVPTFHGDVDVSPIEAVIMINENQNKSVFYKPHSITVTVGDEILIANNATSEHSITSGSGPDDPMAGKFFDTDIIKPRGFVEYVTENLSPGNYSFFSTTDPLIKGQLIVTHSK